MEDRMTFGGKMEMDDTAWRSDMSYGDSRRKLLVSGLLLLLLVLVGVAGYAWWTLHSKPANPLLGKFGSISISNSSLEYGTSWGYPTQAAANARATTECNARTPNADCQTRFNMGETCGGMSMSAMRNQVFIVGDNSKNMAAAYALAQCQATGAEDCMVRENFCSAGP